MIKRKTQPTETDVKRVNAGIRALKACVLALIAPTSRDEDSRRQELILNIILLFSLIFLAILDGTVIANSIRHFPNYHGIHWITFTLLVMGCALLLAASKRGYARAVSYTIIGLYSAGALYGGWQWGASLPAILLSFALISVTSNILIGSRFGFIMSGFLVISLSTLAVHEIYSLGVLPWKYQTITATDVITYGAMLIFIAALSWMSNREIEKSLVRARKSEHALARERDLLEIKVSERTEELRRNQTKRMEEISRIAEFGRLSQGLFHDLMTPLSSVALHMEKLRNVDVPEAHEARAYLKIAVAASHKMGNFMNLVRDHIRDSGNAKSRNEVFGEKNVSIEGELRATLEILKHKARSADVAIRVLSDDGISVSANAFYFQRIFLNLISNAIDAHEMAPGASGAAEKEKRIDVGISRIKDMVAITITDNGPGIAPENISRIFEPFFSTKPSDKGIGLGLSTVKTIVEEGLKGTIDVKSIPNAETRFTVLFPA